MMIIGDSLTSDIQGGINAGISTVWFNPKKQLNHLHLSIDYTITHLSDVYSILEIDKEG